LDRLAEKYGVLALDVTESMGRVDDGAKLPQDAPLVLEVQPVRE